MEMLSQIRQNTTGTRTGSMVVKQRPCNSSPWCFNHSSSLRATTCPLLQWASDFQHPEPRDRVIPEAKLYWKKKKKNWHSTQRAASNAQDAILFRVCNFSSFPKLILAYTKGRRSLWGGL